MVRGLAVSVLLAVLSVAGVVKAQQPSEADRWAQQAKSARGAEDALGQLTLAFVNQLRNGTGAADGRGMLAANNALRSIREQAAGSGLLNLNWGDLNNVQSFTGSGDSSGSSTADYVGNTAKLAASLFVNELASPGAQIVERAQQLGQIATDIIFGSEACGAYTFNPGGAPINAKWSGPTFTLTQTTGNCVVRPELAGEGNSRWTRAQGSLVCLGPSLQWDWTPLKYQGISKERTSLEGPECKIEWKLGTEATVTLYGGDSKDKIVFKNEKEFYAAMTVNKTFDFNVLPLKTALKNIQVRLDASQQKWVEALSSEVNAASKTGATKITPTDLASRVAQRYMQMQQNMASTSRFAGKWTNTDGTFRPGSFMRQFANRVAEGDVLHKGVGRTLLTRWSQA